MRAASGIRRRPHGLTPADRFAAKVAEDENGCWIWPAHLTTNRGYGLFYAGTDRKIVLAHRWSYEHHVGPIPVGLTIDHLCSVRACVNPEHLEPVTHRVNNLRAATNPAAINAAKTHCPQDHPYDEANTYVWNGHRACRICALERNRRHYARRRQLVSP